VRGDIRTIIRETAARYWVLGLALAVSIGGKAALLAAQAVPFNADEAVVALMARHILAGERPLFFYGQAYMGSLDAFLVAGGFALFGVQVWVVRAAQILLWAATMILWHRFCETGFGSLAVARIAVVLLALPPVFLTLYTTGTLGGYGEALFFGSLCLLLAAQIIRRRSGIGRWLVLGLAAGIGFWSFPLSLLLTGPACLGALAFAAHPQGAARPARIRLRIGVLLAGAVLGVLPWIIGWIRMGSAALEELGGSAIAGTLSGGPLEALGLRLLNLLVFGSSALFGLRPSWEMRWLVPALIPIVLTVHLAAGAFAAWSLRARDAARPARWMLAGSAAALILLYVFTPFGNDPSGRYFLPLCLTLAALLADFSVRAASRAGRAAYLIPLILVVYQAAGTLDCATRIPPGITTQFDPVAQLDQRELPAVIRFLQEHGETRGYTNYWVSFPLAFLSDEELIFTARLPYHEDLRYTARDDRYPPYDSLVETAGHIAYITTKNPALDALLESTFTRLGIDYQIEQIGDFRIYYGLSRPVRPEEIFLPAAQQTG
jgi:4-amino-4-deoxy-L-arabinose transferase-like glycosyltransferase